jgi:hypothetical protein
LAAWRVIPFCLDDFFSFAMARSRLGFCNNLEMLFDFKPAPKAAGTTACFDLQLVSHFAPARVKP